MKYSAGDFVYMIPKKCTGFYAEFSGIVVKIISYDQFIPDSGHVYIVEFPNKEISCGDWRFRKATKLDKVLK